MEKWMTTEEIIKENLLSKINIVANVRNGSLTAYDYHSGDPVNLDAMAQQFKEIVEMSNKKVIGTKWENIETVNKYTGEKAFNYTGRKAEIEPFILQPDEWTDKNGIHQTPFIPWGVLHRRLSQKIQTNISLSQYDTILKGWGSKQIEIVIFDSVFLERDILEITNQQQPKKNGRIESELEQILDSKHPWHSEPLSIAVRAWMELYSTRDGNKNDNAFRPTGGNAKLINQWLADNVDKVTGNTTREHYRFIINPSKQGGPQKTLDE